MTAVSEAIPRNRFLRLPRPESSSGGPRRIGVELEFAGLTESEVGQLVVSTVGGRLASPAPYEVAVEGTALGRIGCFLDTALRKGRQHMLSRVGLQIGREVIPVELVTEPLDPEALPKVETLREALCKAGAIGSREGLFRGFGLHLNVEVAREEETAWRPVMTAFALIEDWLRLADPIAGARRLLPFVDPYPRALVRSLLELAPEACAGEVVDLYLRLSPTRNRSLDMLPLFAWLDPARLERCPSDLGPVAARPAFHYRLPDSRVDEPDWRIAYEWNRWVLVERVAADAPLLAELARCWRAAEGQTRRVWCARVEAILNEAGIAGAAA